MVNLKVSVIIPVYNHAREIGPCLESIFNQTYHNFEIIVVNDGSTDDFAEHINIYKDRVKLINQENRGSNAARNRGFIESVGDLLLFCDADIKMGPDMIDAMVQSLDNHPEVSYVYSSFKFGFKNFKLWPFDEEKLKKMNYIHTTSMIRRQDFPGFDEKIDRLQDWDLWLTMLERGKKGWWIDEVLFRVRTRRHDKKSEWVPRFFYKIPFFKPRAVKEYFAAVKVIKDKHDLL